MNRNEKKIRLGNSRCHKKTLVTFKWIAQIPEQVLPSERFIRAPDSGWTPEGKAIMSTLRILASFETMGRAVDGIVSLTVGEVWTVNSGARELNKYVLQSGEYRLLGSFRLPLATPTGIAWTGAHLFVADRHDRRIMKLDANAVELDELPLGDFDWGDFPTYWINPRSRIVDLTWAGGRLWMALEAGGSSSLYRLNPNRPDLVAEIWTRARGPRPVGLAFDPSDPALWTQEGSEQELCRSTEEGDPMPERWRIPLESTRCLAIDDEGAFWTSDPNVGAVFRLGR